MADTRALDPDRNALVAFLKETTAFLHDLVKEKTDPKSQELLFPKDYHHDIDDAWAEFREHWNFSLAERAIAEAPTTRLHQAGLFGAQLRLKLRLIRELRDLFRRMGGKGILRRLFKAIDNLLGSIGAVTGVGHALEEIKEVLNDLLDVK